MSSPKIALVTGGNKGIGFETCRQLAALDHHVLLAARDQHKADNAVRELASPNIEPIVLNVTNAEHRAAAARLIGSRFSRLDVLVNNAGIMSKQDTSADQVSESILRETFDTNFFAVVALTQQL